jgi:hypothetical protein
MSDRALRVSIMNLGKKARSAAIPRTVHVTRFVTLLACHDSPRDAVRRARGHCFALCAFDVADYTGGTPSCSCGYARMVRCPFESRRRKCNFNDSDGIASSHAAAGDVTKMRADSSNSAQLTWRFHSRRPDAVLDANLRALRRDDRVTP